MLYGKGFLVLPPTERHNEEQFMPAWWKSKHSSKGQPVTAGFAAYYAIGGRNVR